MIDKQKVYNLLGRHIGFCESSLCGMDPNPEGEFWIPMCEELSKNVDETIAFLEKLKPKDFEYTLEVLDELVEKTHSQKLLDAVRRIGKEKGLDDKQLAMEIRLASYWLDH